MSQRSGPREEAIRMWLCDDWCYVAAESEAVARAFYVAEFPPDDWSDPAEIWEVGLAATMRYGEDVDAQTIPYSEAIARHRAAGLPFPAIMAMVDM